MAAHHREQFAAHAHFGGRCIGRTASIEIGQNLKPAAMTAQADHIAILDAKSHDVLQFVLTGKRPWSIDLSRDEKTAIAANGLSDDITVIDMGSMQAVQSLPIGRVPHTVVIDD